MTSTNGIIFVGRDPGGSPPAGATAKSAFAAGHEARTAPRKAVAGRVRLATDAGVKQTGRLVDLSANGFCALLDDPVKLGVLCLIDCDVNLRGQPRVISAVAKSVHSVLVSGKGYRVGFQFTAVSDGSVDVVRALLA